MFNPRQISIDRIIVYEENNIVVDQNFGDGCSCKKRFVGGGESGHLIAHLLMLSQLMTLKDAQRIADADCLCEHGRPFDYQDQLWFLLVQF